MNIITPEEGEAMFNRFQTLIEPYRDQYKNNVNLRDLLKELELLPNTYNVELSNGKITNKAEVQEQMNLRALKQKEITEKILLIAREIITPVEIKDEKDFLTSLQLFFHTQS